MPAVSKVLVIGGGIGGLTAAIEGAEVIYNLGADEVDIAPGPVVIYQGSHGDRGAHRADIILPGVDIDAVVSSCVGGWTGNAGQGCSSLTRTLVPRADYDRYLDVAVNVAEKLGCGDPRDMHTVVGPLVSS